MAGGWAGAAADMDAGTLGCGRGLLLLLALAAPAGGCNPDNALIDHPCVNCIPAGASVFYQTTYAVPDFAPLYIGSTQGFDASDPRYRWNGEPYGNWATPIYTHPNHSSATLFLGSAHIAFKDREYLQCMNVKATVNIAAKNHHHMDMMPYWRDITETGKPWRPYPNLSLSPYTELWDVRMTEMDWVQYWWSIEDFVDRYMEAGHSVFVHDHKGCRGGAAAAMYYAMKKQGLFWQEVYSEVLAKRPCVAALKVREWPNKWHLARLKEVSPPRPITTTTTSTTSTSTTTSTTTSSTTTTSTTTSSITTTTSTTTSTNTTTTSTETATTNTESTTTLTTATETLTMTSTMTETATTATQTMESLSENASEQLNVSGALDGSSNSSDHSNASGSNAS